MRTAIGERLTETWELTGWIDTIRETRDYSRLPTRLSLILGPPVRLVLSTSLAISTLVDGNMNNNLESAGTSLQIFPVLCDHRTELTYSSELP